jgi:hypothetical protein
MSKYPITISPNPELQQKVKDEAKREDRNFSQQIWHIVKKYFESKPQTK